MRKPPDFLIAGSAKSGTTALYGMLDQHPGIYMSPVKETNFFIHGYEPTRHFVGHRGERVLEGKSDSDIVDSEQKYRRLFDGADENRLRGEASPWYLINDAVPARIRAYHDDMKVIIILRNPTDVAFANFVHLVRERAENLRIDQVEKVFEAQHYTRPNLYPFCHHLELPRYSTHLPAWLKTIERKNLHIMIYEEFRENKRLSLSGLFDFLGVSDDAEIEVDRRVNVSGLPKSEKIRDLLQDNIKLKKAIGLIVPKKPRRKFRSMLEAMNTGDRVTMSANIRQRFDDLFVADIEFVERMLNREIGDWRRLRSHDS